MIGKKKARSKKAGSDKKALKSSLNLSSHHEDFGVYDSLTYLSRCCANGDH